MKVKVLARNEAEAERFADEAAKIGEKVIDSVIYDGPTPPNSYMVIGDGYLMATPEFFLFRKVAESDDRKALDYICEMFSNVATNLTTVGLEDGVYRVFEEPQMTLWDLAEYVAPSVGTDWEEDAARLVTLTFLAVTHDLIPLYELKTMESMRPYEEPQD